MCHGWRRALLRIFGAQIAATAVVYPSVRIWAPWNLSLGEYSCLSWGVDCYSVARITLGRQALVSQHARLITASHDISSPKFELLAAPIHIADDAWVCAYAYVGMGRTIGKRAIVAATASVTKDVAENAIVGGNPARLIGTRALQKVGS